MNPIANYIDHTILKPTTLVADIKQVCNEAIEYEFAAVCVPPPFVLNARKELENAPVKVATVIGFPFGYSIAKAKFAEVQQAIRDGAQEMDVVINLAALKNKSWSYLESEMQPIIEYIHENDCLVKVIIESGILTNSEIIQCCELYGGLGADFLKTSTGYAEKGATVEAVELMRQHLPFNIQIKASGGIRNYKFAKELIDAGASRLGCSASVAIVHGKEENKLAGY